MIKEKHTNNIALFLALLFHLCGAIGILCTPYRQWFINNTPLNLLLMAALLVYTQKEKNKWFWVFVALSFTTGMVTEMIGVNTGRLFGDYLYGEVLGPKLNNVPWLIGVNWFTIIFCTGCTMHILNEWVYTKLDKGPRPSSPVRGFFFVADAAVVATLFDYIMEPTAVKLGFWQWKPAGEIPFYNFICWFVISAALLAVFRLLKFNKHNQFAVHLFIIQVLFFLVLQTFL